MILYFPKRKSGIINSDAFFNREILYKFLYKHYFIMKHFRGHIEAFEGEIRISENSKSTTT
jgi:hypothetical protein